MSSIVDKIQRMSNFEPRKGSEERNPAQTQNKNPLANLTPEQLEFYNKVRAEYPYMNQNVLLNILKKSEYKESVFKTEIHLFLTLNKDANKPKEPEPEKPTEASQPRPFRKYQGQRPNQPFRPQDRPNFRPQNRNYERYQDRPQNRPNDKNQEASQSKPQETPQNSSQDKPEEKAENVSQEKVQTRPQENSQDKSSDQSKEKQSDKPHEKPFDRPNDRPFKQQEKPFFQRDQRSRNKADPEYVPRPKQDQKHPETVSPALKERSAEQAELPNKPANHLESNQYVKKNIQVDMLPAKGLQMVIDVAEKNIKKNIGVLADVEENEKVEADQHKGKGVSVVDSKYKKKIEVKRDWQDEKSEASKYARKPRVDVGHKKFESEEEKLKSDRERNLEKVLKDLNALLLSQGKKIEELEHRLSKLQSPEVEAKEPQTYCLVPLEAMKGLLQKP